MSYDDIVTSAINEDAPEPSLHNTEIIRHGRTELLRMMLQSKGAQHAK